MRHVRQPKAKAIAALRGALSHALVLLTLFAFTLQGFLTQTHIHLAGTGSPAVADTYDGVPGPGHDKVPSKGDPANCPLCQQFASAGAFVTPVAAATLLPTLSVSVIEVAPLTTSVISRVTHIWRGRAPPLG
jgi:hypothetical protein